MNLILGSAQFSDRYGVSNTKSSIQKKDLTKIFELTKNKSIFIDTAAGYKGSLETIKRFEKKYNFNINLKVDIGNKKKYQKDFFKRINKSLSKLHKKKIYSIMIHDTKNFMNLKQKDRATIINRLSYLKKSKKIEKIGYSIYDYKELSYLKKINEIDIIQLPVNIFDQNFLQKGKLAFFKKKNVEIHARSIFLQGLIFLNLKKVEKVVGKNIIQIKNFYKKFKTKEERFFHCINFIKNYSSIDKVVVGFTSFEEFKKILNFSKKKTKKINYETFLIKKKKVIRPYLWNNKNTKF